MFKNNIISVLAFVILVTSTTPLWADTNEYDRTQTTLGICHLPNEVTLKFLGYLEPSSLAATTRVSKRWHGLSEDKKLSKALFKKVGTDIETVNEIIRFINDFPMIEKFVALGYQKARERQIKAYSQGCYGYPPNKNKAQQLIDAWAEEGNIWARDQQILGYKYGYGYTKNLSEVARLNNLWDTSVNDVLAKEGNPEARDRQIFGFECGRYGYPKDEKKAASLNDEWAIQGDVEAKKRKIEGYECWRYGYPRDKKKAVSLNDEWAMQGNTWARQRYAVGYSEGTHGYPKDPSKIFILNDLWVMQGDDRAKWRQIFGYKNGWYGYPQDEKKAISLREAFIAEDSAVARELYLHECEEDPKDPVKAGRPNNLWAAQGDTQAIRRKIVGKVLGKHGYTKDSDFTDKYIELLKSVKRRQNVAAQTSTASG